MNGGILTMKVSLYDYRGGINATPKDILMSTKKTLESMNPTFVKNGVHEIRLDMKERLIKVALYHNDKPVTPIKDIVLDKTDPSLDNRKIQVDLTLNKNVDAKVLQLKVFDASDEQMLNPIIKENVTNNTLIENDFDF